MDSLQKKKKKKQQQYQQLSVGMHNIQIPYNSNFIGIVSSNKVGKIKSQWTTLIGFYRFVASYSSNQPGTSQ